MFIGNIQKQQSSEKLIAPEWETFGKMFSPEMTPSETNRLVEGVLSFVSQQIARDMKRMKETLRKMRENE
ncbi:MAG: hypothetical protein P0S94_03130 [Simkaniaceae bacterium]|nr:hypothetical protein [Simkaniaceae bacterium]